MPGAIFSQGDRVALRTVEQNDVDLIQRSRNEPSFQHGYIIRDPKNRDQIEEYIKETAKEDDEIFLLICDENDPIGGVGLFNISRDHGTLHYWLLPDQRGNGYATEAVALILDHAFKMMNLNHIIAWTLDDNEDSQAVLRRLGFTHEGTFREHIFTRGEYHDAIYYGITASEWQERMDNS